MKTDIKAILFDIDDTLFDRKQAQLNVLHIIVDSLPEVFGTLDFKLVAEASAESDRLTIAEFDAGASSDGIRDRRNKLLLKILGLPENIAPKLSEIYVRVLQACDTPVTGAVQLIRELSGKYELAAVSNGLPDVQYGKLETIGVRNMLSCIVLSEEVGMRKPDPKIFLHAARLLGRRPDECLFVGDSYISDIIGAKKAGLYTCWFNPAKSPIQSEEIKPDFVVDDLSDITELLK
jgi:HAD superfamily hydrolase (TIGR01549 family)